MQKSKQTPGMENILFQVSEASGERLKLPPFAKQESKWRFFRIFKMHPFTILIILLGGIWTIESMFWLVTFFYQR